MQGVVRLIAAVPDVSASRREEGVGVVDPLSGVEPGLSDRVEVGGQAFDLIE